MGAEEEEEVEEEQEPELGRPSFFAAAFVCWVCFYCENKTNKTEELGVGVEPLQEALAERKFAVDHCPRVLHLVLVALNGVGAVEHQADS